MLGAMAGKSKARKNPQKARLYVLVNKPNGIVSDSQAKKKTKSMDTILGIPAMEVDSGDESMEEQGEILYPKASIAALQSQKEDKIPFLHGYW